MNEALLHPIIIPAIKCEPFECLGDGLLHDGVEREQPNTLKDLLAPTKASKRTPIEDRERPKKWWRAQCFHYGIQVSSSAPISTYRAHLESAIRQRGGLKRPQNLADLEFEQNAKFRLLNAQVRDATTGGSQTKASKSKTKAANPAQVPVTEPPPAKTKQTATAESKAKSAPKPKAEPKQKVKELKAKPEAKTKTETKAKTKAEPSATTDTAPKATARKRKVETVVHVYHYDGDKATSASVTPNTEPGVVHRPTKKARTTTSSASAGIPAPSSSQPQQFNFDPPPSYSQSAPRTKQTARRNPFWKINGEYQITCSSESEWPSPPGCSPSLIIDVAEDLQGLWAILELPCFMTCVLRPKPDSPRPDDGYIRFEWCGREEGEGEILTPHANRVGWLKVNIEQRSVKGMIKGYCGEFDFNGNRVGPVPSQSSDFDWEDYGMEAYEEANRRRWR